MQKTNEMPVAGSTIARLLMVVMMVMATMTVFAEEKDDVKKLTEETRVLRKLLLTYAENVSGTRTFDSLYDDRQPLSKEDVKKFEADLKRTGEIFARHRKAVGRFREALRRYGAEAIDKNLSRKNDLGRLNELFFEILADLDRLVIYKQQLRDRESVILEKQVVIDECQERIHRLIMQKNAVPIAQALAKSVPDWKKNVAELKKLREDLGEKRLTETIVELSMFDKNKDGIVDKAESVEAVKAFEKMIGLSSTFGVEMFDENKDRKLNDAERVARNRIFTMIALERLADLNGDGKTTKKEIESFSLAEVMHFNALAEKYAGIIAPREITPTAKTAGPQGSRPEYWIQSIQSGNSLLIGRANFVVPATLYGVGLPENDVAKKKARDYLVTVLAENPYRVDHKFAGTDTRMTLKLLKKLSTIIITKISFADTRVSTVFEFLKNQSRNLDPEGEGVSFVLYPQPQPKPKPVKVKKKKEPGLGEEGFGFGPEEPETLSLPVLPEETLEPLVSMDLDNTSLSGVLLAVAQVTGCTIELEGGSVYVRLPDAKPRKKQDTLLQLSLYLPKKGRTVNYLLIRNGLATCSITEANTVVDKELIKALELAKQEKLGIWAK